MKQKRILVPNGNYTDIPLIKAYKDMGLYVITSGNNPLLEGHKYADEYVPHDYSDYEGMLEIAREMNLDYVSSCANDFGVTTAAYIAEKLGLPGHDSFMAAKTIAEKDLFKKFGKENGLMIIPSEQFYDFETACSYARSAEYPIIVKPTDLGGGKGVTRVDDPDKADDAIRNALKASKQHHIVIEPFITGTQHSFTAFIVNKKVATYASFNEFDSRYNSFLVGFASCPSRRIREISGILIDQVEKMAELLNLADGIFHIQYRVHNGKPMIMECMRRCLGNYALLSSADSVGFEWEKWIARAHCGLDCSDIPANDEKESFVLEYYIQAPQNGIVESVTIDPSIEPLVYRTIMQWKEGMVVDNYVTQMLGFVFLRCRDEVSLMELESKIEKLIVVKMKQ